MSGLRRRALLMGALCAGASVHAAEGLTFPEPGGVPSTPLFDAALADLEHRPARLPRNGRPMLVNFWARWCGPCKVEIPELVALRARQPGVDVLGIALEDNGAAVRDFARAYEIDYPLLLARDNAGLDLLRQLGNIRAVLPFTLALDRQGQIVALRQGLLSRTQIDVAVQRALR